MPRETRFPDVGAPNVGRSLQTGTILGILVGRDYWGILVVPFTIVWSTELVWDALVRRKRRAPA